MAATWTASITAAAGTSLTQSLFAKLFKFSKSLANARHSGSLYHTFVHCKRFLTAVPRRVRNSISDSVSGLLR